MSDVHSKTGPKMHLQALLAAKIPKFKSDESNLHEKIIDFEKSDTIYDLEALT